MAQIRKGITLVVANQKGGVGKTTTTMNLGSALAERGYRVLLVDSDPQSNLTSYLGVTPGEGDFAELRTLDELYLSKRAIKADEQPAFLAKPQENIDLIASSRELGGAEYYLISRPDRERVLARFLDPLRSQYDFILIDTPPSAGLLTLNALAASNYLLIPVQAEFFSLEGISQIYATVGEVRSHWNRELKILGILASQVSPRRRLSSEVLGAIEESFQGLLFKATIRDNVSVAESPGHGRSVLNYDRSGTSAEEFRVLAQEVVDRVKSDAPTEGWI